jgi:hypothetical protein
MHNSRALAGSVDRKLLNQLGRAPRAGRPRTQPAAHLCGASVSVFVSKQLPHRPGEPGRGEGPGVELGEGGGGVKGMQHVRRSVRGRLWAHILGLGGL